MARRGTRKFIYLVLLLVGAVATIAVLLPPAAGNSQDRVLRGHTDGVITLRFSENLASLATGSMDELVMLWDPVTGERLHVLQGHRDRITRVLFSRDGKTLATGSADRTVRIWDVATGREKLTLVGHPRHVTFTQFSADGRLLAVCCDADLAKIWNLETGEEVASLQGHDDTVSTAVFTPDSRFVVTGSDDRTVKVWNLAEGKDRYTLTGHEDWITSTNISRDGKHLVVASRDNNLSLWNLEPLREGRPPERRKVIPGADQEIHSVKISLDSRTVSIRNFPHKLQLVDLESATQTRVLEFEQRILASAFSRDFRRLITAEGRTIPDRSEGDQAADVELKTEGELAVWDMATGEKIASRPWRVPVIRRFHFAIDGSLLGAASSHDGRVFVSQVPHEYELPPITAAEQRRALSETTE